MASSVKLEVKLNKELLITIAKMQIHPYSNTLYSLVVDVLISKALKHKTKGSDPTNLKKELLKLVSTEKLS